MRGLEYGSILKFITIRTRDERFIRNNETILKYKTNEEKLWEVSVVSLETKTDDDFAEKRKIKSQLLQTMVNI